VRDGHLVALAGAIVGDVSVSRGVEEPSCFLVVVEESVESLKNLGGRGAFAAPPYHSTPKEAPPETGRKGVILAERVLRGEQIQTLREAGEAARRGNICLLTIVVITSTIVFARTTQEVGHDGYPQE